MEKLNIKLWKENIFEKSRIKKIHKEVFDIITRHFGESAEDVTDILLELLLPLYLDEKRHTFSTSFQLDRILRLLEHIFRAYHKYGLLPDECISNDKINLTHCSIFLAGKETKIDDTLYASKEQIVPLYMSLCIQSIIEIGNFSSNIGSEKQNLSYTDNLLYGYTLIMCDMIVWLNNYIEKHPNKEENLLMCTRIPILRRIREMYEGSIVTPEKDANGNWHYQECYMPITGFRPEFKFRLTRITLNRDNQTKSQYKYYVQQFEKIRE